MSVQYRPSSRLALLCLAGLLTSIVTGFSEVRAADDLGNAPSLRPTSPASPGLTVPDVLLPGVVVPGLVPGVVVPRVKLPDGRIVPGVVNPEGKVAPSVTGPDGVVLPGVLDAEGKVVPDPAALEGRVKPDPDKQGLTPGEKLVPEKQPTEQAVPVTPVVPTVQPTIVVPEKVTPSVQPVQPTQPMSPADFLVREKDIDPQTPPVKEPVVEPAPVKQPEAAKKPVQKPDKEPEKEPVKEPKPKVEPKPDSKAKGQPLKVPDDAKTTRDVSFLEGCWKGTRPEYSTKRIITERFCFDDKGVGKRTILDPNHAGTCTSSTRALINENGVLKMRSGDGYCTSGSRWSKSEMTCQGEGNSTPCTWVFGPSDSQSYSIRFVRD